MLNYFVCQIQLETFLKLLVLMRKNRKDKDKFTFKIQDVIFYDLYKRIIITIIVRINNIRGKKGSRKRNN